MPEFDVLVAEAERQAFSGWDFRWVRGRVLQQPMPWDYGAEVLRHLPAARSLLDIDTGGGERLADWVAEAGVPARAVATEPYPPNIPLARERLGPLGIEVVATMLDNPSLPFPDANFDLVINRHGGLSAAEVVRVLRPGGTFLTQQVGSTNLADLNTLLGAPPYIDTKWTLDTAVEQLAAAGLRILRAEEARPQVTFTDIGAVVFQLRAVPWQIPGFTVAAYRDALGRLHERMPVTVAAARFLVEAVRPS